MHLKTEMQQERTENGENGTIKVTGENGTIKV